MKARLMSKRRCYLYGAALAAAVLLFDLWHPLGVAGALPYVALPLFGLLARSSRAVIVLAMVGAILTVVGVFLSAPGASLYVVSVNRGMSLVLISVVAYVAIRHLVVGDKLRDSLRKAAYRDPLTGLYNRRYVFRIFRNELNRHRRYGSKFSLILIDADHFKRVNDEFGHCAGDAALRAIADACNDSVRDTDVVGRFGGEEFIVVLPHTGAGDAAIVAERLRQSMHQNPVHWQGHRLHVTLSLGVAEVGPNADTFDDLLKAADKALYAAKHDGRDRIAMAGCQDSRLPDVDAA